MSFKQKYSQAIVNKVHELSATNSVKLISEAMNLSERTVRYILKESQNNLRMLWLNLTMKLQNLLRMEEFGNK